MMLGSNDFFAIAKTWQIVNIIRLKNKRRR